MSIQNLMVAAVAASALLGCAAPSSQPASSASRSHGRGEAKETAIEVCGPFGERAHLDRLQCSDGSALVYRRVGGIGTRTDLPKDLTREDASALLERNISGAPLKPGEPDYHVIDEYKLSCGPVKRMVYMDMYHCHQAPPTEAPYGFQFKPN